MHELLMADGLHNVHADELQTGGRLDATHPEKKAQAEAGTMKMKKFYKDLEKYRRTRSRQKNRYYGKTTNARNRGKSWEKEEIRLLYDRRFSDHELSYIIGRSVKAIQVQRSRMLKRMGAQ